MAGGAKRWTPGPKWPPALVSRGGALDRQNRHSVKSGSDGANDRLLHDDIIRFLPLNLPKFIFAKVLSHVCH